MHMQRGQFSMAKARYQSVDLSSRIEGATPHQLVVLMFEEALKALDAMMMAMQRSDYSKRGQSQSRVLAIVHSLETSLDFEKGGEVARGLAGIYREAQRLVSSGGRDNDAAQVKQAADMLREIADAWSAIGQPK